MEMPCIRIPNGILTVANARIDLSVYGWKGELEWHDYLGPSFWRGPNARDAIAKPPKAAWRAFDSWRAKERPDLLPKHPVIAD
jgi:hypothetical protein